MVIKVSNRCQHDATVSVGILLMIAENQRTKKKKILQQLKQFDNMHKQNCKNVGRNVYMQHNMIYITNKINFTICRSTCNNHTCTCTVQHSVIGLQSNNCRTHISKTTANTDIPRKTNLIVDTVKWKITELQLCYTTTTKKWYLTQTVGSYFSNKPWYRDSSQRWRLASWDKR